MYTLVFFLSVGMANGAIDKLEADAKAEHIAEVQGLLAARYSKPERQLEADLHRLKSRLASRGRGEDAEGSVASVEAVLALLGEEKRKARLTWQDVWHTTWAHTQARAGGGVGGGRVVGVSACGGRAARLQHAPALPTSACVHGTISRRPALAASHPQSVFVPTYIADCIFWPPLQLINFSFVPLRFQVRAARARVWRGRPGCTRPSASIRSFASHSEGVWDPRLTIACTPHNTAGPVCQQCEPRLERVPEQPGALRGRRAPRRAVHARRGRRGHHDHRWATLRGLS